MRHLGSVHGQRQGVQWAGHRQRLKATVQRIGQIRQLIEQAVRLINQPLALGGVGIHSRGRHRQMRGPFVFDPKSQHGDASRVPDQLQHKQGQQPTSHDADIVGGACLATSIIGGMTTPSTQGNPPATDAAAHTFIAKWRGVTASELSTAQSFVSDLCDLLGVPRPHATPEQDYMFERPITFAHGDGSTSPGRVDCYKRGHFV